MLLPSIYNLIPIEEGGINARKGFSYQDHVGVAYIFKLLDNKNIKEIWFEAEDDIVIIWDNGEDNMLVEFIQVKSNTLPSRWSVTKLLEEEILQKSLKRGRCKEDVRYKIITSYGVDSTLNVLTYSINSTERTTNDILDLINKIESKNVIIPQNDKGEDWKVWIEKCVWDKYPETIENLKDRNIRALECLLANRKCILPYDQRNELYQKILQFVKDASTSSVNNKYTRVEIENWIDDILKNFIAPVNGSEALKQKLREALIADTNINVAHEMRHMYLKENLNHEYIGANRLSTSKDEILELLQKLKIKFDNDEIKNTDGSDMTSSQFHSYCINEIENYATNVNIESFVAKGCMYDITNRCSHRYTKPTTK